MHEHQIDLTRGIDRRVAAPVGRHPRGVAAPLALLLFIVVARLARLRHPCIARISYSTLVLRSPGILYSIFYECRT